MYYNFVLLVFTHIAAVANDSVTNMLQPFKTAPKTSLVGRKKDHLCGSDLSE